MSNKINILYFKMRKTEDSLLNQIIFHTNVQLYIIENENINILMFLKNNREYFIEKYSLIFIELDYLADNVNNRNQFVLSRWNNNLDDVIREKIVVLNYNNFLDGHNLAKIKIKAFYQKEDLLEFLDNEKLLKEKVFLPHEQTSVIEDEFCIFKNPDKEDSQKEDLKDDEQENKHNAESNLEGEENTETSKTVEDNEDNQEIDQEQEKVQEQEDLTAEEEEQEDSTEQEQKVESEEKQSDEQPQGSKEKLPNQTQEKTPEDLFQNEAFNTQTDNSIELNDAQEDEEDEGDSVDRKDLRQFKEKTKKLLSSQVGNLLKKRVKEKEPKKEKREKKQPKTLPESEIKVKKEINKIFPENLPSRYIVNVFGTKEKIIVAALLLKITIIRFCHLQYSIVQSIKQVRNEKPINMTSLLMILVFMTLMIVNSLKSFTWGI